MQERKIPQGNILEVSLPVSDAISRSVYEEHLARPVRTALQMPGWAVNIRCLLLTYEMPLRIKPSPMTRREKRRQAEIKAVEDLLSTGGIPEERLRELEAKKKALEQELKKLNHLSQLSCALLANGPFGGPLYNVGRALRQKGNFQIKKAP